MTSLETLRTFDVQSLPDLDVVVEGALQFYGEMDLVGFPELPFVRPVVMGSGNALQVGRMLFAEMDASFADADTYETVLARGVHDGAVIVSASGGKHAVAMAEAALGRGLRTILLTNNPDAPAAARLNPEDVRVFPKIREPYTYNTATYLGMFFAQSEEDPMTILSFLEQSVAPVLPDDFQTYDAFLLVVPSRFAPMVPMLQTKFDELFGPMLTARVFAEEEVKHAKTVVSSPRECVISFGVLNEHYGAREARAEVPLPGSAGPAAMLAVGYYTIGHIQAALPPYFTDNIARYTREASEIFGQEISIIVE